MGRSSITRFMILALSTCCITAILSCMNTYNFTKICVNPWPDDNGNHTKMSSRFEKWQQSALQSAVAVGALCASIPYSLLFQRFTLRFVFLSAGILAMVSTALVPLANTLGFGFLIVARIGQGIGFSACFPLIGSVTSSWARLSEHGIFIAFLTGCTQLANIFTMPVAGSLCESSWGWPSVYYVHAAISCVLFALWTLLFRDSPAEHFLVGCQELALIGEGRTQPGKKHEPVPYSSILRSKCIWAIWIAAFSDLICVQLVSMYNPPYLNDYLNFSVMNSGILAALPVIVQFACKVIAGVASDAIKVLSETTKVRIFNTITLAASGSFFIVLSFMPKESPVLCIVILTITISLLGFNTAGFNKCATLHSRQHAHFTMAQIMNIWAVTILIEPFVVDAVLTDHASVGQWRIVFIGHAVLLFICTIFFLLWADARPAEWTEDRENLTRADCEEEKSNEEVGREMDEQLY